MTMAHWNINLVGKGLRKASVEKLVAALVEKFREDFKDGVAVSVKDSTPPSTRAERFQAAMSNVEDAKSDFEGLKDELQEWFDNLPEQFQSADKGQELEEAIGELEATIDDLENVTGHEVNFPSMM
jgi:predicted nuclease with TOPRIM domain